MSLEDPVWREQIEGAVDFLSLVDADDRLLYINQAQAVPEDYIGQPVLSFVSPEYHDIALRSMEAARRTGFPQHYESDAVGINGETAHYSNWIFQVSQPQNEGTLAFVATDITSVRRMATELNRADETFRSLVEHAPDYIMMVDRERRLTFANRFEFGFEEDSLLGIPVELTVPEADRERVAAEIDAVVSSGEPRSYETLVNTPEGDLVFSTRAGPVIVDGHVDGVILVSTEITDRFEAERERERLNAQLQQAQKMEALGQLTGGVAHDFNNLLTAIGGNLELVQGALDPDSVDASHLEGALKAVEQAADLTRRLLVFARSQPLVARIEKIDDLVEALVPVLARTLGETVDIRALGDDDLWYCQVDRGQFEQALFNLALNARDAMPWGGTLEILTENIALDPGSSDDAPVGDYVSLTVRDTGIGMDPEVENQAFEPFFTTKEPGRGTGLGLSMVYGFVSQSGGHVTLDSQSGIGTSVQVLLPRREWVESEPDADDQAVYRPGCGELVLVVEDHAMVRELCVEVLEDLGYRTKAAGSASEAIEALTATTDIDVVLTDFGLPGDMNGLELAKRIRKHGEAPSIVLMSGYANEDLDTADFPDGAQFLTKPFKKAELATAIAASLD